MIVLASRTTPAAYLRYRKERRYDYYVAGEDRVALTPALVQLVRTESVEGYARLVYRVAGPRGVARR